MERKRARPRPRPAAEPLGDRARPSRQAIVVLAHRDDTGTGPGANDNASGTAALVELARGYALSSTPNGQVRTGHTIVFLSTDGGAFGGLGALRFARRPPFPVVATINLDAIGGPGDPRIEVAGDSPRSPAASLVETAARRLQEQTGRPPGRASILAQLVDLGFPFTLYEQGPFVARGIPAVTLTTAGARPPDAFTDRSSALSTDNLGAIGRATQQLIGSLDQGLELAQGTTTFVWAGERHPLLVPASQDTRPPSVASRLRRTICERGRRPGSAKQP